MFPTNVLKLRPLTALWYNSFHSSSSWWERIPPMCQAYTSFNSIIFELMFSKCNNWGTWEPGLPKPKCNLNIRNQKYSSNFRFSQTNWDEHLECRTIKLKIHWIKDKKLSRKPWSGGINKLPRNFLIDGRRVHQILKSSKDKLSSACSSCFVKFAALRNAFTVSRCALDPGSESSILNTYWSIAIKTHSRSDLNLNSWYHIYIRQ